MKYILDKDNMKEIDRISIEEYGIPSLVLMERAALSVAEYIEKKLIKTGKERIICVCSCGNNGADGLAAARILSDKGYNCDVRIVSANAKKTSEFEHQLNIIARYPDINKISKVDYSAYNIIVDAMFGIGLSRDMSGVYANEAELINAADAKVVAVDIPSGINSSTGMVMGKCVKADYTITFGYKKLGLVMYPGALYCGKNVVADAGFTRKAIDKVKKYTYYTKSDLSLLPKRRKDSNKGTYGKVLVIAGSKIMGGAAYLSAAAAMRSGAGMVKIITHIDNKAFILKLLPEAMISTYDDSTSEEEYMSIIEDGVNWASVVVAGPGMGTSEQANTIVKLLLESKALDNKPLIADADILNILSGQKRLNQKFKTFCKSHKVIITPHVGEMSRLTDKRIDEVKTSLIDTAREYAEEYNLICVLKDARTIVADNNGMVYINVSGNDGMSTAGSGDVLTGIIAGIIAGINIDSADDDICYKLVSLAVYIHGLSGDKAASLLGKRSMKAGDIVDNISRVLKL